MAAAALLCACQTREAKHGDSLSADVVEKSVYKIYDVVLKQYNESDSRATSEPWVNYDRMYCTNDWNYWMEWVKQYDNGKPDGDVGFFEADYWIMGQDWGELSISDVHVTSVVDTAAVVEFKLHNLGNIIPVKLNMAYEDYKWKIDNFIDVANHYDWKSSMQAYINGEKE